jgi:sphingomyelin phosphodiesterase 2
VIAVGDLNSRPGSLTYRLFQLVGGLSDAWVQKHGEFEGIIGSLSAEDQITVAGVTCDSRLNTWRANRRPDEAVRLDYVFFDTTRAAANDVRVSFTDTVADDVGTYSDHFAIEADIDISGEQQKSGSNDHAPADYVALLDDILYVVDEYLPISRWQKRLRISHFFLSFAITIGLLVAVFWGAANNRAYVGFIFMLISILLMVSGVVDGLIGFLFGRYEARSLCQFRNEVQVLRSKYL